MRLHASWRGAAGGLGRPAGLRCAVLCMMGSTLLDCRPDWLLCRPCNSVQYASTLGSMAGQTNTVRIGSSTAGPIGLLHPYVLAAASCTQPSWQCSKLRWQLPGRWRCVLAATAGVGTSDLPSLCLGTPQQAARTVRRLAHRVLMHAGRGQTGVGGYSQELHSTAGECLHPTRHRQHQKAPHRGPRP